MANTAAHDGCAEVPGIDRLAEKGMAQLIQRNGNSDRIDDEQVRLMVLPKNKEKTKDGGDRAQCIAYRIGEVNVIDSVRVDIRPIVRAGNKLVE